MVEYVAELAGGRASGEASVKIVYAEDPAKALRGVLRAGARGGLKGDHL